MIRWIESVEGIRPEQLVGFFEDWPDPPGPSTHLRILEGSDHVVLALDEHDEVVGFVTAISDGVLSAYIPLLEVRTDRRGEGLGKQLVQRLLERLELYMVDVVCDPDVVPFYQELGFAEGTAMMRRDHERQSGRRRD